MNLGKIGEFGIISRIAGKVRPAADVEVGIGDDAAVFSPASGASLLVTTDMLLEGVHFDLSFSEPRTLGRKSLSVNLSDMAAMGAIPRHFVLSLAIPSQTTVEFIDNLMDGMLACAEEFGVTLIGGDTCSSKGGLVISVTLLGEQVPERVIRRSGASVGDLIFITGSAGDSALGLELLKKGERENSAIQRHLDPTPRVREGIALAKAGIPTAMIDVSDGLLADLGHILEQSGAGARVHLERIPLSPFFIEKCRPINDHAFSLALSGGEDYELLFTAPRSREEDVMELFRPMGTRLTAIGEITKERELRVLVRDGGEYKSARQGYNHFS